MTVLPDHHIEWLVKEYGVIEPYMPQNLQPSSYDVCLGNTFMTMAPPMHVGGDPVDPYDQGRLDRLYQRHKVKDGEFFLIKPSQFVLGVTKERVHIPHDLVCRLEGRSSFGRLGVATHITAGYIDPGYNGNITMEMVNFSPRPILLQPGMRVAQLCFMKMTTPARKPYQGRYMGDSEATHSRYGKQ